MKPIFAPCPCGSGMAYSACCGPFLEGKEFPKTPEALMRSRYTAFTKSDVGYIAKTMREKAAVGFDAESTKAWAKSVVWKGLQVVQSSEYGPKKSLGSVEFFAAFEENGIPFRLHEKSTFRRVHGLWYYIEGISERLSP